MFGESNLFLGFMVHQKDLDNLAQQIVNEYRKGNTTFTAQAPSAEYQIHAQAYS